MNLTYFHLWRRRNIWNKNSPVNIRFVDKTSEQRRAEVWWRPWRLFHCMPPTKF